MTKFTYSFLMPLGSYSPQGNEVEAETLRDAAEVAKTRFIAAPPTGIPILGDQGDPVEILITGETEEGEFMAGVFDYATLTRSN